MSDILRRQAAWLTDLVGGSGLRAQLVRGGAGTLVLKVTSRALTLAVAVLLARQLGPEQYGVYAYALALVGLLSAPVKMGLPTLLIRQVATYQLRGQAGHLRGVIRRANQVVVLLSPLIAGLIAGVAWMFSDRLGPDRVATLAWALLLIPIGALNTLRGAALRGLRHVVESEIPGSLLMPGTLVLLILTASAVGMPLGSDSAMMLHVTATFVAFLAGSWLLWRALPRSVRQAPATFEDRRWLASVLPLALIAIIRLGQQQMDVLMLGFFSGADDVGVYRVVLTGSMLVAFAFEALGTVLGPHAARLHAAGDTTRLQRLITWSTRAMFAVGLPVALVFVVAGGPILGLVFGNEFRRGYAALAILSVAQLVNVGTGSASLLLNMTGHERVTASSLAWSAAAKVILNLMLIPVFGMVGAASASALTIVGWNLVLWRQVGSRLHVDSSVLHRLAPTRVDVTSNPPEA